MVCLYKLEQCVNQIDYNDFDNPIYDHTERTMFALEFVNENMFQITLWCIKFCMLMVHKHFA